MIVTDEKHDHSGSISLSIAKPCTMWACHPACPLVAKPDVAYAAVDIIFRADSDVN